MTNHPSAEALASLVHGQTDEKEARRIEKHLATCPQCYAAYAEAVRQELEHARGRTESVPAEVLAAAERPQDLAHGASLGRGGRMRPLAVMASIAAVAIVVAAWAMWRQPRASSDLGHILVDVRESSARGMVLPGGEGWADHVVPEYRGPEIPESSTDSLAEAAIRSLAEEGSADQAVWALSGYVAQGRLRIARAFVVAARRRFADDVRLEILDGVISYREGDPARAETVLREVVTKHPHEALARLDLGLLLAEQGNADAKPLIESVIRDAPHSPLANRARRVLEKLPS